MANAIIVRHALAARDLADLPAETAITIRFEELTSKPDDVLQRIYRQLRLPGGPAPLPPEREDKTGEPHAYSLEDFGLTEAGLRERFAPILALYGF